jgi:hypothetical protein
MGLSPLQKIVDRRFGVDRRMLFSMSDSARFDCQGQARSG